MPAAMRNLQQQAAQVEVTVVTTAKQLQMAVDSNTKHIEIRDHLDLTKVLPQDNVGTRNMLWSSFGTVQSIRVRATRVKLSLTGVLYTRCQLEP